MRFSSKFGQDYTKMKAGENFDNIVLLFDGEKIYWVTCSNEGFNNYDEEDEFIMGFYLTNKDKYNAEFDTKISYDDILNDLKEKDLDIAIHFDRNTYDINKKFKINANDQKEFIDKLMRKLLIFQVKKI